MKKAILFLVVIAVLVIGGWYYTTRNKPAQTPQAPQEQGQTVTPQPKAPETQPSANPDSSTPASPPLNTQPPATENQPPAPQAAVVIYTDNGYSPAELRVKAGTTVIFKNQSSGPVRTASNPHPVHTDLPGFDAKAGTAPGESYSFKFTQKGTWGYHNHLEPSDGGQIIVE